MRYHSKAKAEQQKGKPLARLWFGNSRAGAALSHWGERMDIPDALWYGAVTPGEALEKPDRKQQELGRLIGKNRADLAALHPEAGGRDGRYGFFASPSTTLRARQNDNRQPGGAPGI